MLKKILSFYMKFFALWVVLFGIIAYFCPAPFLAIKDYNQLFFAVTMFGIGAVLDIDDFKRIAQRPIIVLIGSTAQFLIMPIGAFAFSHMFGLPPELAVGLILAGSAPGAMASNVMCYIGRADTAYSVSLTTVSTLLCPLLTPGLTKILAGATMVVPFWPMFFNVTWMVLVPLAIGFIGRNIIKTMIVKPSRSALILFLAVILFALALNNHYKFIPWDLFSAKLSLFLVEYSQFILASAAMLLTIVLIPRKVINSVIDLFPAVSATFIIFICSLVIAMNKKHIAGSGMGWMLLSVLAVVVSLNIYGMCAGYGVGKLFKMTIPRRRTLCIEIGMQNAGLGTVLALEHFGEKAAIPTAMFVFVCIITASILVELWRRKDSVSTVPD